MATATSGPGSNENTKAAKRARTLARKAMRDANELTMRVLEGGRSPRKVKRAAAARKARAADAPEAEAMVAPIGLKADVTPRLVKAAPAFGDVLRSLAHAAAVTQTLFDEAALQSLKTLAGQQVEVPVLVEQNLDNDGIPTTVTIQKESVPLTSIITPSMQQVDQLTVRMDMRVESFDSTSGIKFNQNMSSAGASYKAHGFGFATSVNNTNVNAQFSNLSDFSAGSLLVSMDIVDRTGFQIPKPLEYGIGANLIIRLLRVTQTSSTSSTNPPVTTITRSAEFSVKQANRDGSIATLGQNDCDVKLPAGLLPNWQGTTLTVTRNPATAADAYEERTLYVIRGHLIKELPFYI